METKSLLYGLIGFFLGGLIVALAAGSDGQTNTQQSMMNNNDQMTMMQMTEALEGKRGDEFDAAFIAHMIDHHEGAVVMAQLSEANAKHEEIKELSRDIISAQEKEIDMMKGWQKDWGYTSEIDGSHRMMQ